MGRIWAMSSESPAVSPHSTTAFLGALPLQRVADDRRGVRDLLIFCRVSSVDRVFGMLVASDRNRRSFAIDDGIGLGRARGINEHNGFRDIRGGNLRSPSCHHRRMLDGLWSLERPLVYEDRREVWLRHSGGRTSVPEGFARCRTRRDI